VNVEGLFGPAGLTGFLAEVLGRRRERYRGPPERFEKLISWPELARVLAAKPVPPQTVGVIRQGKQAALDAYLRPAPAGLAQVDVRALEALIDSGGALFLAQAHHLHRGLWDMTRSVGRALSEAVNANIYYGRARSRGFGMHVDHHDVIVLQVEGKKQWYGADPTFTDPLLLPNHSGPEPKEPTWSEVVEPGDVMYVPRGTWHRAEALEGASLHVSLGIQPCTGLHFLGWMRDRLMARPEFRRDIPRYGGAGLTTAHLGELRAVMAADWTDDLAAEYLRFHRERIEREQDDLEKHLWGSEASAKSR
jgi:hypothetical protein